MKLILLFIILTSFTTQALPPPPPAPFELLFNTEKKPVTSKITISFTGDLLVHQDLYKEVINRKKQDFSVLWTKITPLLNQADFSQVNLEGPAALGIDNKLKDRGDIGFVYDGEVYSGTNFLFNFHPQIIEAIKNTGFDFITTSNNHTFDRGAIGVDKTIDALNEKKMPFAGTRKKGNTDPFYKITDVKDFKVAWISCSEMLNGFKDKFSQTLLCYDQATEITDLIKKVKSQKLADIIIVIPHWGVEYDHEPAAAQKKHARLFAEAGADAIIGSHPHVLQPAEKLITKDNREVFVVYSLGNFLAYQKDIDRKTSAIIYLEFSQSTTLEINTGFPVKSTWISNYRYQPTVRSSYDIFPAAKIPEVVTHAEKYLGKFKP
ncbi:MAG: CapA family protein [Bdellovibrionaceae bacterium]|nr:CapA family protein [Pseudobdellovibrionaceae bacterium]